MNMVAKVLEKVNPDLWTQNQKTLPAPLSTPMTGFSPIQPDLGYTPYNPAGINSVSSGEEVGRTAAAPMTDKRIDNILANVDVSLFGIKPEMPAATAPLTADNGLNGEALPAEEVPAENWWGKTKEFLSSPFGRSLGTSLLTGGLVGLTGGSGLEALSYGAQAGGTAAKTWREQRNKDLKRQLERDYFQSKLEQHKSDQELRQQQLRDKTQHDYDLADYKHKQALEMLGAQNQGAFDRSMLQERAKNEAELEKGVRAVEMMRPSVEESLKRAKESLASGDGLGPIGGRLAALGMNTNDNSGDNYANIESANAQMNALLRQRLQATGLTGTELNSAVEANAYRYTISPFDPENIVKKKIDNFERDYLRSSDNAVSQKEVIRVQAPDGKIRLVPRAQLSAALKQGGKVL